MLFLPMLTADIGQASILNLDASMGQPLLPSHSAVMQRTEGGPDRVPVM